MHSLTTLLSPFNLLFLIILSGFAIGKIHIKHFSLDIAGILFASIFAGVIIRLCVSDIHAEIILNAQSTMKIFSKLGTSLFVSVIGFQTGLTIKSNSISSVIAFVIGSFMSMSGITVMMLIYAVDKTISFSSLLGVLCGALTSTPGLSCVCELLETGSEKAVMNYGCAYFLGVVLVVLFTKVFSNNTKKGETRAEVSRYIQSKIYPEFMLICIVSLLGNIIGGIKIACLNITFGTTSSLLIVGLIVGFICSKASAEKYISAQCLNIFRSLGLALFFTGTGFATGIQSMEIDMKSVLYGALITLVAILFGKLLCKIASSRFEVYDGFIVAGGMTSSPAYGAISDKATETSINCFSFSYFGALITLILLLQIII